MACYAAPGSSVTSPRAALASSSFSMCSCRNALPDLFGLVRIDRLADGSRARPVDVNGHACRVRRRFDEFEMQRGGQVFEQGEPGAEGGRLNHEPVLVDQPQSRQRLVEGGAAVS